MFQQINGKRFFALESLAAKKFLLVELLYVVAHLLHFERRPDERAYALAVVVADWFADVVFERTVAAAALGIVAVDRFALRKYFTGFVTRENGFPMKPAPDAIRYLLDEFQLDPAETIMIGDREIDILSGKNAGIHTCLFTDGNPGAAASEAEYTAGNMAELYALFLG